MQQLAHYLAAQGSSMGQAQQQAITWIGQHIHSQASLLAYIDVFWTLMFVSAMAVPVCNENLIRIDDVMLGYIVCQQRNR